jgi:hypothetical protein
MSLLNALFDIFTVVPKNPLGKHFSNALCQQQLTGLFN